MEQLWKQLSVAKFWRKFQADFFFAFLLFSLRVVPAGTEVECFQYQKQDERYPEIEQKEDKLVKIYNVSQKQEKDYISKRNNTAVKPW